MTETTAITESSSFLSCLKALIVQMETINGDLERNSNKLREIIRTSNFTLDDHDMDRLTGIVDMAAMSKQLGIRPAGNLRFCYVENAIKPKTSPESEARRKLVQLVHDASHKVFESLGLEEMVIVSGKHGRCLGQLISCCLETFHEPARLLPGLNPPDRASVASFLPDILLLSEWLTDLSTCDYDYNVLRRHYPLMDRMKFMLALDNCRKLQRLLEDTAAKDDPDSSSLVIKE